MKFCDITYRYVDVSYSKKHFQFLFLLIHIAIIK